MKFSKKIGIISIQIIVGWLFLRIVFPSYTPSILTMVIFLFTFIPFELSVIKKLKEKKKDTNSPISKTKAFNG